jgi:hypothetical protein
LLHLRQPLVIADGVLGRNLLGRFARANHIDSVQLPFLLDRRLVAAVLKHAFLDRQHEMLGHLVAADDLAGLQGNLRLAQQLLGPPSNLNGQPLQISFRGRQQLLAPLTPNTTRDRPNRSRSLSTWSGTVVGSPVLPGYTSTATGRPRASVNSP